MFPLRLRDVKAYGSGKECVLEMSFIAIVKLTFKPISPRTVMIVKKQFLYLKDDLESS